VRAAAVPSASACSGVTAGLSRASANSTVIRPLRPATAFGDGAGTTSGIHISASRSGNATPGFATPTIVAALPSITTPRPTIDGSRLNRSRQPRSLSTAMAAPPSRASFSRKNRPIAGVSPSIENSDGVTSPPSRRTDSPSCVTV
jgi:hypothetical protein